MKIPNYEMALEVKVRLIRKDVGVVDCITLDALKTDIPMDALIDSAKEFVSWMKECPWAIRELAYGGLDREAIDE